MFAKQVYTEEDVNYDNTEVFLIFLLQNISIYRVPINL